MRLAKRRRLDWGGVLAYVCVHVVRLCTYVRVSMARPES